MHDSKGQQRRQVQQRQDQQPSTPDPQCQQAQLRVLQGVEGTDKVYCLPAAGAPTAAVVFFVGDQLEARQLPPRVLELQARSSKRMLMWRGVQPRRMSSYRLPHPACCSMTELVHFASRHWHCSAPCWQRTRVAEACVHPSAWRL